MPCSDQSRNSPAGYLVVHLVMKWEIPHLEDCDDLGHCTGLRLLVHKMGSIYYNCNVIIYLFSEILGVIMTVMLQINVLVPIVLCQPTLPPSQEFWSFEFVFSVSLLDTVDWWVTGRTSGL